jgi:hypothetical protein
LGGASVCAAHRHFSGDWFNLFAAVFAAASLGYLTPAEPFCTAVQDSRAILSRWSGTNLASYVPCALRMISNTPTDFEALHSNSDNIQRLYVELPRLEKSISSDLKNLSESSQTAQQAFREQLLNLDQRIKRLESATPQTK